MPKADAKSHMIACYGDEMDRSRLLLVAEAAETTMSGWLVGKIREAYAELYGEADPTQLLGDRTPAAHQRGWGRFSSKGKPNA